MYDPHKNPDIIGERDMMNKGRLVKVRLADQPAPNVTWMWMTLGNCRTCRSFGATRCNNPDIKLEDFYTTYMFNTECPKFEAGVSELEIAQNPDKKDVVDVMRAVGLVEGEPEQAVTVIADLPWTIENALRAHREQSTFLAMAHHASAISRGEVTNDPSRGEYVDLSDDLERPAPATPVAPPNSP